MSTLPINPSKAASYSAAPSLLGYLYQIYLALKVLIRESEKPLVDADRLGISIELIDDVALHAGDAIAKSIQSKSHLDDSGEFGDSSADIWKTIRAWLDGLTSDTEQTIRCLVSTQTAAAGTAASLLRDDDKRDVPSALTLLDAYANASKSDSLKKATTAWNACTNTQKLDFLSTVYVTDQASDINLLLDELGRALFRHKDEGERHAMTKELLGWWHERVLRHLCIIARSGFDDPIRWLEVRRFLDYLLAQYPLDGLPNDFGASEPDKPINPATDNRLFVHHLRTINCTLSATRFAIREHWRASEQRSKWIKDLKILPEELDAYDDLLKEEWEHRRDAHWSSPDPAVPIDLIKAGHSLFNDMNRLVFNLRSFSQPFLTRGTFHRLANEWPGRLGWHPEWEAKCLEWKASQGASSESAA